MLRTTGSSRDWNYFGECGGGGRKGFIQGKVVVALVRSVRFREEVFRANVVCVCVSQSSLLLRAVRWSQLFLKKDGAGERRPTSGKIKNKHQATTAYATYYASSTLTVNLILGSNFLTGTTSQPGFFTDFTSKKSSRVLCIRRKKKHMIPTHWTTTKKKAFHQTTQPRQYKTPCHANPGNSRDEGN